MPRSLTILLAGLALSLAACSTQAAPPAAEAADAAVHPVSGLDVIPLTITQNVPGLTLGAMQINNIGSVQITGTTATTAASASTI